MTVSRDIVLEAAARSLAITKDARVPRAVRDEAGEIASEMVSIANRLAAPECM